MATVLDMVAAIDGFLAAPKTIFGADQPLQWGPGYNQYEQKVKFPLEINGELQEGARLELTGFPWSDERQFRICLCFNAAICRIDYTDETHPNTERLDSDNVPPVVTGHHYHSWPKNRRFFKGVSSAPELKIAESFEMNNSFEDILRWFCNETNIAQLNTRHLIELPRRDRLL